MKILCDPDGYAHQHIQIVDVRIAIWCAHGIILSIVVQHMLRKEQRVCDWAYFSCSLFFFYPSLYRVQNKPISIHSVRFLFVRLFCHTISSWYFPVIPGYMCACITICSYAMVFVWMVLRHSRFFWMKLNVDWLLLAMTSLHSYEMRIRMNKITKNEYSWCRCHSHHPSYMAPYFHLFFCFFFF